MFKSTMILIPILALMACGKPPTASEVPLVKPTSAPAIVPTSIPTPDTTPTPTITSTPPPTCKTFSQGDWVSDTPGSIVDEFNNPTGVFTEKEFSLTCVRTMSAGVPFGDPMSLVWPVVSGVSNPCNAISQWMQFNVTSCNKMTVIFRDGSSGILETDTYTAK